MTFVLLAVFLTFLPSLNNQFVNWDDTEVILNNPLLRQLSIEHFRNFFTQFTVGNYHPLTNLSFAIECQGNLPNSFLIHLDNVILHLLNTALVFWFVILLTGSLSLSWMTALMFGIHPLHVESVAWATERKDVLYTFFYLGALICYQKRLLKTALALFILSLFSKVQAVSLPAALFAIDFYNQRKDSKTILIEKIPFITLSLLFVGIALYGGKVAGAYHVSEIFNWVDRLWLASTAFVVYVTKLILPFQLSCLYPYPDKTSSFFVLNGIISLAFILGASFLIWKLARQNHLIIFGVLFFVINIFLGLQLFPVGEAYMSDRFSYVASIGIFLLIAMVIDNVMHERYPTVVRLKQILWLGFIGYLLILGIISFTRSEVWHDGGRLWSDVINQYPDYYESYLYRGDYYRGIGNSDKALRDYANAITLKPDSSKAYVNRGNLYQTLGHFDLALADYNKALQIRPQGYEVLMNRANTLSQMGNFDAALSDYYKVLSINPDDAQAYYNRGVMFTHKKDLKHALEDFNKAKKLGLPIN